MVKRTCLHAQKASPNENATAIQQPRNDVAKEQGKVCPRIAHIDSHVLSKPLSITCTLTWLSTKQGSNLLVGGIRRTIRSMDVV
jgi:hypothetical protein